MALVAAAFLTMAWWAHANLDAIRVQAHARVIDEMEDALRQDEPAGYRRVVALAERLSQPEARAQAMRAYAATVLAIEHQDASMRPLAAAWAPQAPELQAELTGGASEGLWAAAQILAWYGQGDVEAGERLGEQVLGGPEHLVLAKLEVLRLQISAKREAARIQKTAACVALSVMHEVRALSDLGMWALSQNNTALAEQYFHRAIGVNPHHMPSVLGLHYVRLSALALEPGTLWQAQQAAADVLGAAPEATTPPLQAMALLLRAQAFEREGHAPHAQADRDHAYQLDPGHWLHDAAHDAPARP